MRRLARVGSGLLALLALACGAIEERGGELPVDRFAELVLVDPELVEASADADSALPSLTELLGPLLHAEDVSAAQLAWLEAWADASDEPPRLRDDLLCRWLGADASNACDAACAACASRHLAASAEPFRLAAVVYRPDLALDAGTIRAQGQLRLVYALTEGPASDRDAPELPLTVIVELPLSARLTAGAWVARFHALGALRADLLHYRRALRSLVDEARAVDDPEQVSVRVRDAQFADGRLFAFAPRAQLLRRIPLEDTVDPARVSVAALEAALPASQAKGATAPHVPSAFWADSVDRHTAWPALPDAALSSALRLISCHGCHADEHSLHGFHVAPGVRGRQRVSRFLHDPDDLDNDELARREDALRTLLRLGPQSQ